MTKNEAVQVNLIYLIFKRPLFSGHLCCNPLTSWNIASPSAYYSAYFR